MNKKLKKSSRGLTFSLDDKELIGTKYRYFIDKKNKSIIIVPDDNGNMTVFPLTLSITLTSFFMMTYEKISMTTTNITPIVIRKTLEPLNILIILFNPSVSATSSWISSVYAPEVITHFHSGNDLLYATLGATVLPSAFVK